MLLSVHVRIFGTPLVTTVLTHIYAVLSIVGIIAQAKGVLCESGSWSFRTAKAYITLLDAISITYVLFTFHLRTGAEPAQDRPLWSICVLWFDEGGAGRQKATGEVPVNQAYRYVHLLSIICRKFLR